MRRVTWLAGLGVLWLIASSGVQADTATAFQQGRDTAASGAAAASAVNATNATGNGPGYNTAPTEAGLWRDGKVNLSGDGLGKQAGCTTANTSGFNGKECDAINFLGSGRPEYPLTRTDALFNLSNGITKNNRDAVSGMNGGSGTGGCTTVEVKDPDLQSTEHCEEFLEPVDKRCPIGRVVTVDRDANYQCEKSVSSYESLKCRRGFSVNVGTVIKPESFDVNRGSEVPGWSASTFTMNFTVKGTPDSFKIERYQVDNYGQVWINGTKVYENVLPGYSDMRWGSVGYEYVEGWGDWGGYSRMVYKNSGGVTLGDFYDDGCNWGCRGAAPNLDITRYIRQGNNEVVLVCANANGIGPCAIKITGSARELVVLGSLVDNQCSALENRAK